MGEILSVFTLGISFGLILFLLAAGLSLTMGLMRIINMAHGALFMVAAYLGVWVNNHIHNWVAGVIAGALCAGVAGLLLEVGFLRRLYKQEASQVLLTIGFIYILQNLAQWVWGTLPMSAPVPKVLSGSVPLGTIDLPIFRFFIIGFGLLMAALLWLLQDKTKIGGKVRAGMDNREIAGALGINLKLVFTGVFALGSLVAGMCGLIGGQLTGVNLGVGWQVLLYSLIVVVIGGTGSVQGALLGGVIIGLLNSFGTAYFPSFANYIIYVALIVILLIRPSGLLGRKIEAAQGSENLERIPAARKKARRGAAAAGAAAPLESAAVATSAPGGLTPAAVAGWRLRLNKYIPYIFILLVLAIMPTFLGTYSQGMITKVLIFAMFAMSLDVLMGYTGLISFGHAAYFGLAGYFVGVMMIRYNVSSFWLILIMTIVLTAIIAAILGYLCLRVSGIYFLLVTMAFGQLLYVVATKWYSVTGGTDGLVGIPKPNFGFHVNWTTPKFYYFVLIMFIVCYYILYRIMRSSFGKSLIGVRQNEPRMRSLGFNTWLLKYVGFIVAGVFAGIAGTLFAYYYGAMVPSYFALETSALPMLMVIMGGGATLWGPCLGAAVIILVQQEAGIYMPDRWPLILGGIFVLCVMLLKGGFARYLTLAWSRVGLLGVRPAAPTPVAEEVEP